MTRNSDFDKRVKNSERVATLRHQNAHCATRIPFAPLVQLPRKKVGLTDKAYFILLSALTIGPQSPPKRVLQRVLSSASSFNFQYLLFSLRSVSAYVFFLVYRSPFSFHHSFNNVFYKAVLIPDVTKPVNLPSFSSM